MPQGSTGVIQGFFPNGFAHFGSAARGEFPAARVTPQWVQQRIGAGGRAPVQPVQQPKTSRSRFSPNSSAFEVPRHLAPVPQNGGQPLAPAVRQRMESLFATTFADIRVHVDQHASSLGALAFTQGSHIHFAPGQYETVSPKGLQMLAHELTHVVQQRAGRVRNPFNGGVAVVHDRALEQEADRMAMRALVQRSSSSASSTRVVFDDDGNVEMKSTLTLTPPNHQGFFESGTLDGVDGFPSTFVWVPDPRFAPTFHPGRRTSAGRKARPKPSFIRRSARVTRKLDFVDRLDQFVVVPEYTAAADSKAGGRKATATLSANGYVSKNSVTDDLPSGLAGARKFYPQLSFVSGHLLNEEFGGDGKDRKNVTILTSSANSNHKSFDNRVKDAVGQLKKFCKAVYSSFSGKKEELPALEKAIKAAGVAVTVTISGSTWGASAPDCWITTGLTCTARLVGVDEFKPWLEDSGDARELLKSLKTSIATANANGNVANTRS